jgi:hypothetical protein
VVKSAKNPASIPTVNVTVEKGTSLNLSRGAQIAVTHEKRNGVLVHIPGGEGKLIQS